VKIDVATIEAFIKLGIIGIAGIQKIRAYRAARKLEISETPDGPDIDDATYAAHFVKWMAAADEASAHASERLEARHDADPPAVPGT
jgi:hypothetical protein